MHVKEFRSLALTAKATCLAFSPVRHWHEQEDHDGTADPEINAQQKSTPNLI